MNKKYIILILILAILFLGSILVNLLSDWLWFSGVGWQNIFTTILGAKVMAFLAVGLFSFIILYVNLKLAAKITQDKPILIKTENSLAPIDVSKYLGKIILFFSIIIGFFTGLAGSANWDIWLKYLNKVSFNQLDPIFNYDISFYFFTLPFLEVVIGFLFWIIFVCLVGIIAIYLSRGIFRNFFQQAKNKFDFIQEQVIKKSAGISPKVHVSILVSIFLLLSAIKTYFIKIPNLVYSTTGPFAGASYTDLHASLPILKILSLLLVVLAGAVLFNIFQKKTKILFSLAGLYLLIAILGGWLYPVILQKFVVAPNELVKETPYIIHNIKATQQAFKLDQVQENNLTETTSLTMEDIQNNQGTIKNIRLWDREPLLDTFGQVQEIRTYYDFISIDNDRYQINGDYRQILLSPRELNSASLPQRNFINEHLTFTHGFGLTLGPVNEVTEEGLPLLFIKDLPPTSTIPSLQVTRPGIYYGELTDNYAVVNTRAKEFDYPAGEKNVFTDYQGSGGVLLDSFWKKALMAFNFKELKLILSEDINSQSRIMYFRNIQKRVSKVMPFLKLDQDPYLVVASAGQLKWIYDAYTISDSYPYAEKVIAPEKINYIRNSVKIVIDAYDGDMRFYISEPDDPLIQTYAKIFPETFLPLSEMPGDLKAHLRYPEDIFRIQTSLYSVYHMEEPQIFYNKEDKWQIPRISEGRLDPMMRHIIMKLPDEDKEEFILMIPFTPQGKDNLAAWMVARSDGENYGKLAVYRFSKQNLVFGPSQIINRINQNPEISQQISLWDQRGSNVNQGPLLVIPIEESLLYVRPLYLRAEGGRIPELKRVIVAYQNQIVMEETLEEGLNRIFGQGASKKPEAGKETSQTEQELIQQAKQYYQNALQAQRNGDWTRYGEEIEKLGSILEKLK